MFEIIRRRRHDQSEPNRESASQNKCSRSKLKCLLNLAIPSQWLAVSASKWNEVRNEVITLNFTAFERDFTGYRLNTFFCVFLSRSAERAIKYLSNYPTQKVLTSGRVVAIVTQQQIHVIKYMASFVIFPGGWGGECWADRGRRFSRKRRRKKERS